MQVGAFPAEGRGESTVNDNFVLQDAAQILGRTPAVLQALLSGLPEEWTTSNEGPDTWSPYDVIGHLVHGEKTDWLPRAKHILQGPVGVPFEPFDRFAQFRESQGKSLNHLLTELERLRSANLQELASFNLTEADLDREGIHPALGRVTLRQLLATWVCHDLSHLAQIARVMARRYCGAVGPWKEYLSILNR